MTCPGRHSQEQKPGTVHLQQLFFLDSSSLLLLTDLDTSVQAVHCSPQGTLVTQTWYEWLPVKCGVAALILEAMPYTIPPVSCPDQMPSTREVTTQG